MAGATTPQLANTPVQIWTFAAFGVSYSLATVFLCLRYFQGVRFVKKIELDLRKPTSFQD